MRIYESHSDTETYKIGFELGKAAKSGEIYCLDGELGVGKTVFTKGFAAGLGIEEEVDSPTFTIVKEYAGENIFLYHFDVYRIISIFEMDEIGYEDYFFGEGICLIEWSANIKEIIPNTAKRVEISKDLEKGFEYRKIVIY